MERGRSKADFKNKIKISESEASEQVTGKFGVTKVTRVTKVKGN